MADDSKTPARFSRNAAKRIIRSVLEVERRYLGRESSSTAAGPLIVPIFRGSVSTAIPTGSLASPSSSGAVQLLTKDVTGAWVNDGNPVIVFNDHTLSASVAVGKVVKVCWIAGDYYLLASDC